MAKSPVRTLRVKPGSALDRLTQGRNFSKCVNELADRYVGITLANRIPPPPPKPPKPTKPIDFSELI